MANKVQELIGVIQELESGKYVIPGRKGDTGQLQRERQQKARQTARLMQDTFNEAELRELCVDMGMDYEDVAGNTKTGKINDLVGAFYRHNTLDVLIDQLSKRRPLAAWPETRVGT